MATDQNCTAAGSGDTLLMMIATTKPMKVPATPPSTDSVTDSVRICQTMSRRLAPSALRRPISRVRSLTTISMMFMITMPPTTSDSATTPTSTAKIPLVAWWYRSSSESDVSIPKLSGFPGLSRRWMRIATVASSMATRHELGRLGLDQELHAEPRAEHLLELAERDDRELVLGLAEHRALLLADADDPEVLALDRDDLVDRVRRTEEPLGRLPAEHGQRTAAIDFRRVDRVGRARR